MKIAHLIRKIAEEISTLKYMSTYFPKNPEMQPEVDWAMKTLKRSGRVNWYLNLLRKSLKNTQLKNDLEDAKDLLEHYMGMCSIHREFETYKFPPNADLDEVLEHYKKLENDIKLEDGVLIPEEGIKLIDFHDGYAWWDLQKSASENEGKSLGHCGNLAGSKHPKDTLLSLRKEVKKGNETFYQSCLTFQLNNGYLGQMKGRSNSTPAPKYHKYIVELLKNPRIKHVVGGGYKPETNFHFIQLTEKEQQEVLKANPHIDMFENEEKLGDNPIPKDMPEYMSEHLTKKQVILQKIKKEFGKLPTTENGWFDAYKYGDEHSSPLTRRLALQHITDPQLLKKIAIEHFDSEAIDKITDKHILTTILNSEGVGGEVANKIVNNKKITTNPKMNMIYSENKEVRTESIDKLTDKDKVNLLVYYSQRMYTDEKKHMVEQLSNQNELLPYFDKCKNSDLIQYITDPKTQYEILLLQSNPPAGVTDKFMLNFTQDQLKHLVYHSPDEYVQTVAMSFIEDQDFAVHVLKNHKSTDVKEMAMNYIAHLIATKEWKGGSPTKLINDAIIENNYLLEYSDLFEEGILADIVPTETLKQIALKLDHNSIFACRILAARKETEFLKDIIKQDAKNQDITYQNIFYVLLDLINDDDFFSDMYYTTLDKRFLYWFKKKGDINKIYDKISMILQTGKWNKKYESSDEYAEDLKSILNINLTEKEKKVAKLVNAFSRAIYLEEIPPEYKKYKVLARGNTSIILEKDSETVIMLTRDAMKKDWLDIGIEISKNWIAHDVPAKNRKFNDFSIYAIEMPKLYKLDAANTRKVNEELKFFKNSGLTFYGFGRNSKEEALEKMAEYYEEHNKTHSIIYALIEFLRMYDHRQWNWDLARRQFAQDKEGNIILVDPVVSADLLESMVA